MKARVKIAKQQEDVGGWIGRVRGLETQTCVWWRASMGHHSRVLVQSIISVDRWGIS